ncbi:MAG TPA: hypothetical protein DCS07_08535 [Bdellovibrionales bacterium]|nr:MAG: hypothetical protein A2Z97_02930 [Bdellovibrionales bacterium GWB1_52_6]OFZ03456.1 MAG: hypothetical protein A2X97_05775 [Bdellovibrionales bacterium GWA1_52_35]OFZ41589.1 MAG: hypothetical protein A2070_04125 [Bdellovibrionales bacterium GWC1_52_8]HAR42657.1 hypothetical protein [Bdellovibrionales bacterium]HCM41038.1 hypothetical protein [Bdellovibrionales bacterium]
MDGYNEKKWFVYIGDHHEGPFALAEIEAKIKGHQITSTNFVWCDGMPDWKAMAEIPAFSMLVKLATTAGPESFTEANSQSSAELAEPSISRSIVLEPVQNVVAQQPEPQIVLAAAPERPESPESAKYKQDEEPKHARKKGSFVGLVMVLLVLLGITGTFLGYTLGYLDPFLNSPGVRAGMNTVTETAQPYLLKAIETVPALGQWISPIPSLNDVSPDDYEQLKNAALAKLEPDSLKVALALSKTNTSSPTFYLSSNLPDGARFDIFVVGLADTLLNQTSFFAMTTGTVLKRLGKTEPLRLSEGQMIPRGQYIVYAMEAEQQMDAIRDVIGKATADTVNRLTETQTSLPQGRKVIAVKQYFLGGAKDASYSARLKEYHDRLREKAQTELTEVRLFAKTIEDHLNLSISKYNALKKGKLNPAQKKLWAAFSKQWSAFDGNLNQSFLRWSPSILDKEYFYGALYKSTVDAGQATQRAHKFHHAYFTTTVPLQGHATQVEESVSSARNALAALTAKIKQAEALASTANGMPRREGL